MHYLGPRGMVPLENGLGAAKAQSQSGMESRPIAVHTSISDGAH